ncbi:MAG TPA: isoamylase early set domain-containing protein [Candidatus Omnitrophota bacterium]|nr:isoamylase early set domain-containing protein [Candidatus Omnitrophota bacterium]
MATKKAVSTAKTVKTQEKEVTFSLSTPKASKVTLVGSFNNWNPQATPLKKAAGNNWSVKIALNPGRYEYKFWVDGRWENDPKACGYVTNPFGSTNCVVDVK